MSNLFNREVVEVDVRVWNQIKEALVGRKEFESIIKLIDRGHALKLSQEELIEELSQ